MSRERTELPIKDGGVNYATESGCLQMRNTRPSHGTIERVRMQTEWEKMFAIETSYKQLGQ